MAIVKMKRLRLAAMGRDREELLTLLQRMGCVEIDEPASAAEDPDWAGLIRSEATGLADARDEQSAADHALEVLSRYAPQKSGLLQAKPGATVQQLFDSGSAEKARKDADEINEAQRRISAIRSEQTKIASQKEALAPWLALDLPLETSSTPQVTVQLGTLPAAVPFADAQAVCGELTEISEVSSGREYRYILLVSHASESEKVLEALKELGWSRASLREWTGTAKENTEALEKKSKELEAELAALESKLSGMGGSTAGIRLLSDKAAADTELAECLGRTMDTDRTFFLEGWVPEEDWPRVESALAPYPCAFEVSDPAPEDYPEVPVKLKNNAFTRPLNMVTDMYSLPAYGSMDPNPLMAPFFIFFYGMMMADMGYGIVMMLIALIVIKKAKPTGPTVRNMFPLLGLCGVSTFIFGALTGSFFGDMIPQLVKMMTGREIALPALFSPLNDALMVLIGSLCIGVVQIFTGMAISCWRKITQGNVLDAVFEEITWYIILIGAVVAIAGITPLMLIAGAVLLVAGKIYGAVKQGGGAVQIVMHCFTGIFGSLYNNITGYFSDILSYSRLMALMLAGAVIAQVFNTLGAITGNVIGFFVISIIGNALNFALNILGCFVHDMRLQCLEFFSRFYEDGGQPFRPLDIKTKYVRVVKE